METNRIYFKGNPWPEGHPIQVFVWSAKVIDGDIWFDIHLETADYYAERDIENNQEVDYPSDWEAPIVWGNYHACTLSSTNWHDGGFRVCAKEKYAPEFLDHLELEVDSDPNSIADWDDFAFHIYLLGHDAAAKHKIKFERLDNSMQFKIHWSGEIALVYTGDSEFKHEFSTLITAEFPQPTL